MSKQDTSLQTQLKGLMDKEVWHAKDVGLSISADSSTCLLPFDKISPFWLKKAAKQFIYSQAPTRTYNTCRTYIKAILTFGYFIIELNPRIKPENINRRLLVDYIHYLSTTKQFKPATTAVYLVNLKRFFEINHKDGWVTFSPNAMIYQEDFPKIPKALPRFIPESVIAQLLKHLPTLGKSYQRLILLFLETGRRRGEIFTLPYGCLHKDGVDDYFMEVKDCKMAKSYMIPVSIECAQIIKEQQEYTRTLTSSNEFLFVRKNRNGIGPLKSRHVHAVLVKLAEDNNITDDDGRLWNFSFHQFRHTVGTRMINADVPQHIVQRFLGHESSKMTERYATIHDSTLKKEFIKFQNQLSNHQKKDIFGNGPIDKDALIGFQQELDKTKKLIAMAKLKGWQKQLNMNIKKQQSLEKIISNARGSLL